MPTLQSFSNRKKCSKNVKKNNSACQECLLEVFTFARIDLDELLEISFHSISGCKCLKNDKENQTNTSAKKLLNVQGLSFSNNPKYIQIQILLIL